MPRRKPVTSLLGMVETDMEDDTLANAFPTPDSNQENGPAKKKGRPGKATAKKFTKPRTRHSGDGVVKNKAAPKTKAATKRAPLKEQKNVQQAEDTEEVDEFDGQANEDTVMDELVEEKQPAKRKPPGRRGGRPPKKAALQQVNATEKDGEFEYTPTTTRQTKVVGKLSTSQQQKSIGNKRQPSVESRLQEKVIPETQMAMDTDPSEIPDEHAEDDDRVPQSEFRRTNNARTAGRTHQPPIARKRAGSASDVERAGSDPVMRRKIGEMTKKLENIELKYKTLKETIAKEAELNCRNFEAKMQARGKAADDLIASLKKELSLQKALAKDSRSLQTQITARDADLVKTQALADQLSTSLSEAQNENKALQAKLANSRNASTAVESLNARTPGGDMRGKTPAARTVMVGSAEAAQAAQVAQLKEDLYSDLTGLILRGVERGDDSDVYDCLQTGPNGTLHFKLSIAKEADGGYDNTEFQYTPRLDSNRDRDLISLLPEYLTDEITFSRTNAAMFYGRVVNCLTRKRSAEGQDDREALNILQRFVMKVDDQLS